MNFSTKFCHPTNKMFLICLLVVPFTLTALSPTAEAVWFFQRSPTTTRSGTLQPTHTSDQIVEQQQQVQATQSVSSADKGAQTQQTTQQSHSSSYGSGLLSIAGIQPSNVASVLNAIGNTGFSYFNIQQECRNRAACDLGFMLYKKLSFIHNWLIRTSVRSVMDMNNGYCQSWMEGMLGRNCSSIYVTCRQSPLEGIMNLALLQHLIL